MSRCLACKDNGVIKTNFGNRFCDCREGRSNQEQVEKNAKVETSGSVAGYVPEDIANVLQVAVSDVSSLMCSHRKGTVGHELARRLISDIKDIQAKYKLR